MTARQAPPGAPAPVPADADLGRHLITVTTRPDTVFVDGQGSWLTDERGKRHLDLVQGWAVNSLGHSPAVVAEALAVQARRLLNPSPAFHNRPMLDLAARLVSLSGLDRVWFGSSASPVADTCSLPKAPQINLFSPAAYPQNPGRSNAGLRNGWQPRLRRDD